MRLGVTGTDTGVGKTIVAAAAIASLRARGLRVAPMKPIETGIAPGAQGDADALARAAGGVYPVALVRPLHYRDPLAPLVAARREYTRVKIAALDQAFDTLLSASDAMVVEGAGGLLVPITETETFATLFARWQLALVIVGANRLGVINHTMLTVESARAHGIALRAVVLNTPAPETSDLAMRTNQAILQELLPGLPVLTFPHIGNTNDLSQLAAVATESGFAQLLT